MMEATPAAPAGDTPRELSAQARRPRLVLLGSLAVSLLTLVAYQHVVTDRGAFEFLNLDDNRYIVENPRVTGGLTASSVSWALTSLHQSNWHPLTWMSWQLDHQIFGLDPWGFHLTNVLLHVANAVLLFLFLHRATGSWGRSLTVASLFAVHPLHVESVVWVSERKDVLSTFFCLLSLLAYVAYATRPRLAGYLPVLVLFALGLAAKSMLLTLPGVLLLVDYWPLGRLSSATPTKLARLVGEKLPLFALAAVGAVLTLRAQTRMMEALPPLPLAARAGNALVYYVTYVGRSLWPVGLSPYHPNPGAALGWLPTLGAALALAGFSMLAWRARSRRPYLLVGWLWFLGTLVPVIGLVQVGFLATADHYTYVPLIGLFVILAWAAGDLCASLRVPPRVPAVAAAVVLGVGALLTRREVRYWRDSVTVWQHILDTGHQEDALVQAFLGQALEAKGRDAEAEAHYARAAELDPSWKQHVESGLAREKEGDLWGARREFEAALRSAPHEVTALQHLAAQFQSRGELEDALRQYATLARIRPLDPGPEYNMGLVYQQRGDQVNARRHWARAVEIDPALAAAVQKADVWTATGDGPLPGPGPGGR